MEMPMKSFKQYLDESGRCWTGYKPVKGKKAFSKGSCVKEDGMGAGAVAAGPTNVTGVATSTDPASATAVNRKKKRSPILMGMATRKAPK
jgi:hypothetical protein